ncbi:MAG: VWA domain-containing protein [Acidobacteriota bacterium]
MRGTLTPKLVHILVACGLLASSLAKADSGKPCRPADQLAEALLSGSIAWGDLTLETAYTLDEQLLVDEGVLEATLLTRLTGKSLRSLQNLATSTLCVSVVLDAEGELPIADHRRLEVPELRDAKAWTYGARFRLPETAGQLLLILEDPTSGLWGAAIADESGTSLRPGPAATFLPGRIQAWHEVTGGARPRVAETSSPSNAPTLIRLVPPRRQTVKGLTRFDALVSSTAVDRVVFELDGQQVAERKRSRLLERPFAARIDLADPPRPQTLLAIAFDDQNREIGRDTLMVNEIDAPLRVRISELSGDPSSGSVEVAAEITIPAGSELERIELYRNQTLLQRFDEGPVRARVATPEPSPEDFIRIAAFLTDGSSIDDVVLLSAPLEVEEVEVNLVELHVVVTDDQGEPVSDLAPEDFTIIHRGKPQSTQSFAHADDVALLLGLVIDTSGSMRLMMHDTGKAAIKFLGTTVLELDRAFLVDFALRPRLLHPTTADLPRLLVELTELKAEGKTAMYDAIVFSMLQFERQGGRKALVVLTDGDDIDSRFGPKYCVDLAYKTGVPVYVIGLSLDSYQRRFSKKDLRRVTEGTGGRLYFVESFEELDRAYAQINAELRSQYSLSFYVDGDLEDAERRDIEVRVNRSGLTARTVIGAGATP